MSEKETGRMKIEGFTKETISAILEYIYTGKCQNLSDLAESILPAADQFMLPELKCMCAVEISAKLSPENVVDFLKLADLYSLVDLKFKCSQMISSQPRKIARDNLRGLAISNVDLFLEVFARNLGLEEGSSS